LRAGCLERAGSHHGDAPQARRPSGGRCLWTATRKAGACGRA